jgi:hypothetical protein
MYFSVNGAVHTVGVQLKLIVVFPQRGYRIKPTNNQKIKPNLSMFYADNLHTNRKVSQHARGLSSLRCHSPEGVGCEWVME